MGIKNSGGREGGGKKSFVLLASQDFSGMQKPSHILQYESLLLLAQKRFGKIAGITYYSTCKARREMIIRSITSVEFRRGQSPAEEDLVQEQ